MTKTSNNLLEISDEGIVYQNPTPHLNSRQAMFASVVQLEDGRLMAAYDIGEAFEAVNVRSYYCFSSDFGKSWSPPELIFTPDESETRVSTSCRISKSPSGEVYGLAAEFLRPDINEGLVNPENQGFVETRTSIHRFCPNGHWEAAGQVNFPLKSTSFELCSPLLFIDDDHIFFPTANWPDWQAGKYHDPKSAWLISSSNRGKTWDRSHKVFSDESQDLSFWEHKQCRLSDGRWMGLCWVFDHQAQKNRHNVYSFADEQLNYGPAIDSPILGETCTPIALADNHILCFYRKADQSGLWAHLAKIEGNRWHAIEECCLWGKGKLVENQDLANRVEDMKNLRFGFPWAIQCDDGSVFLVFWCQEDGQSIIRYFRMNTD